MTRTQAWDHFAHQPKVVAPEIFLRIFQACFSQQNILDATGERILKSLTETYWK